MTTNRLPVAALMTMASVVSGIAMQASGAEAPAPTAEQVEFFEAKIRPILAQECYECHRTGEKVKGGLALDHREALRAGGDSGAAIVPGDPKGSLLIQAIRHELADEDLKMPKSGAKLEEEIIADFERWVAMGAPDPRDEAPSDAEVAADTTWEAIRDRRASWWSFQPIRKPAVPEAGGEWSEHAVDRFIAEKLTAANLQPGQPADLNTLVRRTYFTLIGLPPTPEQVERFVAAAELDREKAFAETVDELLASPHFGERWARHWMDWIRYAESHGSEGDPAIPAAYQYRDYLTRALNADVPYDQLLKEHVAGDLLVEPRTNETLELNESAIGPAHWRMVFHGFTPTDALDEKVRFTDDQINVFTKAFQAMTVSCARCHDHKFDAISQADFYALFGILGSSRPATVSATPEELEKKNLEEIRALKEEIRMQLSADWLDFAEGFAGRLLDPDKALEEAIDDAGEDEEWLALWRRLSSQADAGEIAKLWKSEKTGWEERQREARERREELAAQGGTFWNLADAGEYRTWHTEGAGLAEQPSPAGEFSLRTDGEMVVRGIYPAGVFTHTASDKHRGILASEYIALEGESELWLNVIGDGKALTRYVVQNYPRKGTVYPATDLDKREWRWLKYDLAYWTGDDIHIELTTAADTPVHARLDNTRSWFGIREAVMVPKGAPEPGFDAQEWLAPVFETGGGGDGLPDPASLKEVAQRFQTALVETIRAWQSGSMSDGEALFLDQAVRVRLVPNHRGALKRTEPLLAQYLELEAAVPVPVRVPGVIEGEARDQALFVRGDHKKPGDPVPRRFLEAIDDTPYQTTQSGRLELAEDLVRGDNPFTRRVIVNRLWHHLFGKGIVPTADNFGRLGGKPSHPELLDYLAVRFSENGWSLKDTIRYLVTSRTWQLSSDVSEEARSIDPSNELLSHANVRRLEAEAIRDSLLSVSGEMEEAMYGPSLDPDSEAGRRSLYLAVIRNDLPKFLEVFDAPVPFSSKGRRDVTNVPAQSLTLLNDPFVIGRAGEWAKRVMANADVDEAAVVRRMFLEALAREPSEDELDNALAFVDDFQARYRTLTQVRMDIEGGIARHRTEIANILEPARLRLMANTGKKERPVAGPEPVAFWDFEKDFTDRINGLEGASVGDVRIEDGALVVEGKGFVATKPLERTLTEKTLEAWVQLEELDQQGGGIFSIQNLKGDVFDAIVIGERRPRRWVSGSNTFTRTKDFDGPDEDEAHNTPIHIAIAYRADGTIQGFRNGEPYGEAYQVSEPVEFAAGDTQVLFGLRHGNGVVGNRVLKGRILEAKLYDRALDEEAVRAAYQGERYVSDVDVLGWLPEARQREVQQLEQAIAQLEADREKLGPEPAPLQAWADLGHALFNVKEFIYLK